MAQPPGYEVGGPNTVCRLRKALYGLRQAPRAWYKKLRQALESMGIVCTFKLGPWSLHSTHTLKWTRSVPTGLRGRHSDG
jgi:hypothetical protein